jgi:hypothetical protein
MHHFEITPGLTFHSETAPENWLRVEAINDDGSFMVSFPGRPEFGTATVAPEDWRDLQAKHRFIASPLAL